MDSQLAMPIRTDGRPPGWWPRHVSDLLRPAGGCASGLRVLDLFAGAGGLSLGFRALGCVVHGIDSHPDAVATYAANVGTAEQVDLRHGPPLPASDIVLAGPPCQPWSRAGSRRGAEDARDGLPVVLRVIRDLQPRVAVIENVPELARRGRHVLDGVRAELHSLGYATSEYLLDSSRYDVPQRRMRLFTVAAVEGLPLPAFPPPGTAAVSVLEALGPGCLDDAPGARLLTPEMDAYVARYERASGCRRPRDLHLDAPARTVTASNIARATGDMLRLRLPDGRRRMLTLREAARLQGFPDWFAFAGSHASQAKQIGNAVPPLVARALAATVLEALAVPAASLSRAA